VAAASVRAAAAAVTFLTRVPVGRRLALDAADVARGAALFPAVGAGIGALAGLAAAGLEGPLPPLAAGGLGVGLALVLTGALHLDALADTADGLGAGRARALEVMRDSRIGSFGAAAVAVTLLVESALLGSLAAGGDAVASFAAAGALSRAVAPPVALAVPYARGGGGAGGVLSGRVGRAGAAAGAAVALAIALPVAGWHGAAAAGLAAAVAVAGAAACRAWIGGVTGDTLGALTQAAELGVLALLAGLA
jgi:adenosylcobinamide-GDP ribazoletransferase